MSTIVGYGDLSAFIRERPPLLMVDRLELDTETRRARAVKCVSMDEEFFQGHFPGAPIMPGVLQVAAMSQVGGALFPEVTGRDPELVPWLKKMRRVKFRKPVYPGDLLLIEAELIENDAADGLLVKAKTSVGGAVTCQGELTLELKARQDFAAAPAQLLAELSEAPENDEDPTADLKAIADTLPHRFPFLLLDRALKIDLENTCVVGLKNVTGNEPFFAGTAVAAMPLYLQVEAAAQAACAVALKLPENVGKLGYFMSIDEACANVPVVPGDQMVMSLSLSGRGRFGVGHGKIHVGDSCVTETTLKFAIMERA